MTADRMPPDKQRRTPATDDPIVRRSEPADPRATRAAPKEPAGKMLLAGLIAAVVIAIVVVLLA